MKGSPEQRAQEEARKKLMIAALAEFFTGSQVGHQSVLLQASPHAKDQARQYFALREMLGIRGYPTAQEAIDWLTRALA